jgi:membrane protein implicated in regulation of membrane protease activity
MEYAGLIIFFILLWIRPEYMFLLFYVIANSVLVLLLTAWSITPDQIPVLIVLLAINNALLILIGAPIVALRKWLKTRKTGGDKKLDKEMDAIRAEIAARGDGNG